MHALKLCNLDNQRYPSTEQGFQVLVTQPSVGPAPLHWQPFLTSCPATRGDGPTSSSRGPKGEVDVYSFGADEAIGGDGKNAAIGSSK